MNDKRIRDTFELMSTSINSILNVAKSIETSPVLENVANEINKILEKSRTQMIDTDEKLVEESTFKTPSKVTKADSKKIKKEKSPKSSYIPVYQPENTPPKKVTPLV